MYDKATPERRAAIDAQLVRLEKRYTDRHTLDVLGLWLGFVLVVMFLVVATVVILNDHGTAGTVIATVDIVAIAGIFVLRQYKPGDGN